jgi:Flp pilus assembly pilin Flp
MTKIWRFWTDNDGQDVAEYALIAILISLVALAAVTAFGQAALALWAIVDNGIPK